MIKSIREIHEMARQAKNRTVAVACAQDEDVLLSLSKAAKEGLVKPLLVGKKTEIEALLTKLSIKNMNHEIINCEDDTQAAEIAVKKVSSGEAQMLMKGLVATSTFLKAVLNKDWGLRKRNLLSHVTVFEAKSLDRIFLLTDAAMTITPDLSQKVLLIENAADIAMKLGINKPKVAPICAVEVVNPEMPSTIDAAILSKMSDRGQIKGCIVDGPLSFDNAVSMEAAKHKKIQSPVAGQADIILCPNIDVANAVYKTISFVANAPMAAILSGATAPIILTSRADSDETKFNSIMLAIAIS